MKLADEASPTSAPTDVVTRLVEIESALAGLAEDLVPERVAGHRLERVMGLLGRIERRAGGARLVLAKAAADAGAWKAAGARSAAEHLARQSGTSLGEAKADLAASERLAKLNQARDAAMGGELSKNKTRTVAEGADADSDAESDLVATAKKDDLGAVRDKARKARQRADQRSGQARRRRYLRRGLRLWSETDGEGRGAWNVPAEFQAAYAAALEPYRAEAFRLARQAGTRPSPDALMADALQLLCLDVLADHDLDAPEGFFDPACPDGPCTGHDDDPVDSDGDGQTKGDARADHGGPSESGARRGDGDWYRNDTTRPRRPPANRSPDEPGPGAGPGRTRPDRASDPDPDPGGGHGPGARADTSPPDPDPGADRDRDPAADGPDPDLGTLFPAGSGGEGHPPSEPAAPEAPPPEAGRARSSRFDPERPKPGRRGPPRPTPAADPNRPRSHGPPGPSDQPDPPPDQPDPRAGRPDRPPGQTGPRAGQPDRPLERSGRPDRPPGRSAPPTSRPDPPDPPDRPPGRSEPPLRGADPPPGPADPARQGSQRRFAERRRIGGNRRRARQVVVRVDHSALVRGSVEGEETCEIAGIGPVPVSAVRRMCEDAILRVIVTKGVDVVAISTDTRYVAADVQRALDSRDPECVVPGCRARHHLQNHHWRTDHAQGGPTELDNLARTCPYHHALITHCDWTLTGGPGHWQYNPP